MSDRAFLVLWGVSLVLCAVIIIMLSYGSMLLARNHEILQHINSQCIITVKK